MRVNFGESIGKLVERWFFCGRSGGLLAFVGSAFEIDYASEDENESDDAHDRGAERWKIADQHGRSATERAEEIQRQDRAAMAEAEVR